MCDNQLCEKEWFHLSCTNLKDFPNDATPWYCSNDCRKEGRIRVSKLQQHQPPKP